MNRLFICFVSFNFVLNSCNQNKITKEEVIINNPVVDTIINKFMGYLVKNENTQNDTVITLGIRNTHDSSILFIGNGYPDLSVGEFRGSQKNGRFNVYFVGDKEEKLYIVKGKSVAPDDILLYNRKLSDPKRMPSLKEPNQWEFYFKKGVFIGGIYPKGLL